MKKILILLFGLFIFSGLNNVYSSTTVIPVTEELPAAWKNLKLSDFVKMTPKDYASLTGKKMTAKEKIAFSFLKMKMKHAVKKNQNVTVNEFMAAPGKLSTGVLILLILGIIAIIILIAALISLGSSGWL